MYSRSDLLLYSWCLADPTEQTSGAIESVAIMMAVVLIILVSALINWMKDLQFRGLQQRLDKQLKCLVVRNGDIRQIYSNDVVVGDICIIKYGIYQQYLDSTFLLTVEIKDTSSRKVWCNSPDRYDDISQSITDFWPIFEFHALKNCWGRPIPNDE